jgi:CHRD domain-containing protein/VCBS repeat protein
MSKRSLNVFLTFFAILVLSGYSRAETFTAYLSGAQEVPANPATATGYARIVVNETAGTLQFTVVFNGLTSAQTGAHIHAPAAIGVNAAVIISFGVVGGTSGTITGSSAITPTQLSQLRQHLGYVNVHSTNNPGGEIRGQLGISRPVDYDGDGRMDLSILRFPTGPPSPITYWNSNSTAGVQVFGPWGNAQTDFPVPGDYDGDAKGDFALYRAGAIPGAVSEFFVFRSSDNTAMVVTYGMNGDQAHCRDYDGDGKTDLAIFRRGLVAGTQAVWWIKQSTTNTDRVVPFGITGDGTTNGDTPVSGDYDGDGKFDIAVYRFGGLAPNNSFIVLRSSDGAVAYQQWGSFTSDYVVPGDYDGDGKTDYTIARTGATAASPMVWWILQSSNGTSRVQQFGVSSDLPIQGDYDGDARTDISVYRPGATTGAASTFWIFRSFDNTAQPNTWGVRGDFPVATFDAR